MAFADVFAFGRPTPAAYVDAAGVTRIAGVDQPRYDHAAGRPRGLLVEPGAELGQQDRVLLLARDWSAAATWTILHERDDGVAIRAEAHYSLDPAATIGACLALAGWHRRIAAVAGYCKNYGGWVSALDTRWALPAILATRAGVAIAVGRSVLIGG